MDDFKILLIEEGYDMVFVTESWTQAHIGDAEINVEGYDLFRKDRKTSRGGGCLIFRKKHLKITLIEDLTFNFESESVWCMCKTCDYELVIGVCYRNPSACDIEEENLHDCIKVACYRYKNIIIVGDFSQRVVDQWNRLPTTTVCAETINRFKNQIDPMLWQHGGLFISQRRLPAPVLSRVYTSNANLRRIRRTFCALGCVFSATNADLRRRDRSGAECKHSYNTPSFTRGCWIVIG